MSETPVLAIPETPLAEVGDTRIKLAELFVRGDGLEIGALHLPTVLPSTARARYVDRMSVEDLRAHYPELETLGLTPVDVIDDGETLATIAPGSVDFVVANHFLEHCQDPIRTIQTHLSKLRPGGTLFYAVPDKRFTFDFQRPRTTLEHVITDHEQGPEGSRADHYVSWVHAGLVPGFAPRTQPDIIEKAAELEAQDYSIHFHVWTESDLVALMFHIHERLGGFEVEAVRRHGIENIVVLRKHGERPADSGAATAKPITPAAPLPLRVSPPQPRRAGIPLAAMRPALDAGSAHAHWLVDPDRIEGRAWLISSEAPVTVPLRLDAPVVMQARAQLLPHDWREGTGSLRAWIVAIGESGQRRMWSQTLSRSDDIEGVAISCRLEPDTTRLQIGAESRGPRDARRVARFALVEPYLTDTAAPAFSPRAAPEPPPVPATGPLLSVLCPVHDPPAAMLDDAVESVLGQTYPHWELILSDDGCTDELVVGALDEYARRDARIKLTRRAPAGGISVATNAALTLATGKYVALLDHDDTLDPGALAHFAHVINQDPELDMLYSDEDIVLDGRPVWVHLKPDWSPDTLNTNGYTCHLGVYRRTLVDAIGGFRSQFNGSQDVDMILRLTERSERIAHVPETLYHWRIHPDSTAGGDAKPYAYVAARNAIAGHLERCGIDAEVEYGPPGLYRVVHRVEPATEVALVLAVEDERGLAQTARSWLEQPHADWTVVIAAPAEQHEPVAAALLRAGLDRDRLQLIAAAPKASRAAALTLAARATSAAQLFLMESPWLGLSHDWLTRLIGYAAQPWLAAAGPIVLSPDGRIAHGGVATPDGMPLPLLHGEQSSMDAHFGYGTSVYNVRAVDGALMTRAEVFAALDGLDPAAGSLALVDYCLRAERDLSLRAATIGDVRLAAVDDRSPVNDLSALRWFTEHWGGATDGRDPYYNPQLRTDRGDFVPRVR